MIAAKLLLLATAVSAHTLMTNFYVDGANQDYGTCVRMSNDDQHATDPVRPITSNDMACGVNGGKAVARVCPVNPGSVLTFQFNALPDQIGGEALDSSHKGPCAVYMKKVDDSSNDSNPQNQASGPGWFKIFEDSYDNSTQKWCTERLIMDTKGLLSVKLPSDLASGHYLLRTEALALQEADKNPADPQFYVNCVQIFMKEPAGSAVPKDTVSIPGYVDMEKDKAALTFHIWDEHLALPYPQLGPPAYTSSSSSKRRRGRIEARETVSQTTQTTGLKPDNCVLEVGNWCGIELASYSTEDTCWNASTACWDQATACYDSAGPTGGERCHIWEDKCTSIQDACNGGNFQGPPDVGKILTPQLAEVQVPPAANGNGA